MRVTELKVNHMVSPCIDNIPEFSWHIESEHNNVIQTAYEICVRSEAGVVWTSGKVYSEQQSFVEFGGALRSNTKYCFSVTVWDNKGETGYGESCFETAFLSCDEWKGCFVKSPFARNEAKAFVYGIENPAVIFERTFEVSGNVTSAKLFATAYGAYRAYLGGERIGTGELAPEYTPYNKILNYQCYDLTDKLKNGKNELSFLVGDGWFFCAQTAMPTDEKIDNLSILYQIEITYADGRHEQIFSDGRELCRKSNIVFSDLFMGEKIDMTLPECGAEKAVPADFSLNKLRVQPMPQIKVIEEIKADRIYTAPNGDIIVDFGQIIAGRCRININEPYGTELSFEHTEVTEPDGNYFQTMIARQCDTYISDGKPCVFEPVFTFHGFRYVRVSGMNNPEKEDFTALLLSTEKEDIGSFRCSDERFNRLYKNIRYSQKNNMMSVPTDCPTREKAGWTGDILIYAKTAMQNEDMTPFLSSWLSGLSADQKEDGVVTIISPFNTIYDMTVKQTVAPFGDTDSTGVAGWSDAMVWVPYEMYKMTGNIGILKRHWSSMEKWCAYIIRTAEEKRGSSLPYEYDRYLWNTGFHFGEWLVPGRTGEGFEICKETACYVAPFFGYMTLVKMSEIAQILGKNGSLYRDTAEKFKWAIQTGFMRSDILPDYLQGLYVLALAFDLVPQELYDEYSSGLIKLVEESDRCLCTGFLATPFLLDALIKVGRRDLAKAVLWQSKRPSWLFEVTAGATTIWESWFAMDENGKPDKISYDHYAFGVIDDFIFRHVCGITALTAGFTCFRIEPETDWGFDFVERRFHCESGEIYVSYDKENLKVKIPCNTRATVVWQGKEHSVGSGTYTF